MQKIINAHDTVKESEQQKQTYQKVYVDQRRKAKYSPINVGDRVLVKQEKRNKLSTRFSTTPYTVISRTGTKITARNNHRITPSHFKKIVPCNKNESETSDNESEGQYQQAENRKPVRVRHSPM